MGHVGVAFATTTAAIVQSYLLLRGTIRRGLYRPGRAFAVFVVKVVLATAAMVLLFMRRRRRRANLAAPVDATRSRPVDGRAVQSRRRGLLRDPVAGRDSGREICVITSEAVRIMRPQRLHHTPLLQVIHGDHSRPAQHPPRAPRMRRDDRQFRRRAPRSPAAARASECEARRAGRAERADHVRAAAARVFRRRRQTRAGSRDFAKK